MRNQLNLCCEDIRAQLRNLINVSLPLLSASFFLPSFFFFPPLIITLHWCCRSKSLLLLLFIRLFPSFPEEALIPLHSPPNVSAVPQTTGQDKQDFPPKPSHPLPIRAPPGPRKIFPDLIRWTFWRHRKPITSLNVSIQIQKSDTGGGFMRWVRRLSGAHLQLNGRFKSQKGND